MEHCRRQVKEDCEELLGRFQRSQSVRFEAFSQIWRDMKFEQIFYGVEFHERRPFCRLVLDVASQFFLPPFTYHIRVGGLFLLYALAHKQLAEPPEQVRLALKDWKEVQQFEEDSLNARHYDVVLILRRLLAEKLVQFTATPTLLCYRKKREVRTQADISKEFLERTSRPLNLISTELLEELANIHHVYKKLKTSVPDVSQNSESNRTRQDLVSRLEGAVLEFSQWQNRDTEVGQREVTSEEESLPVDPESSRRAQLLSRIKTKAFQTAAQTPKSRRHRQVQVDSQPSRSSQRCSRPSLKARTIMHVQLTGDLEKEASTTTSVSRLSTLDSAPKETQKTPSRFSW
ncbi:snRNA-activating protein complex subunit 1b [Synchiropus splendidus]|uniref:snRNA-activating protein complex subunit 1b n=1 Tax=Synchiropus splendidus TaxID=270530 RepID=UPI00237E4AFD|nr:snRNA-activating protein complex subunit 1b [Synchiropus splendidus]